MTQPNSSDHNAIAGCHPGAKSAEEMKSSVEISIDTTKSLSYVANKIVASAEWHLNSFTDVSRSPKYSVDPSVSYYGSGSLSLISRLGKLIFSSNVNDANRGAFSLDHGESNFYSNLNNTTLGSLKIDTVDGYELNVLSPIFPSTNYSPTRPWVKKLFPTLSSKNLMTVAILELIQAALFKALDKSSENKVSESFESKDIAAIIIDNQELEDQILGA